MRLSTRSRYGVRMVLDIALNGDDGPVRIGDIAKRQGISMKYLEKLIRILKQAGYIKSKRGPKGGHSLARPLQEITVGEVVRVLEGQSALTACVEDEKACQTCDNAADCLTRELWTEASEAMFAKLDSYTLAEVVKDRTSIINAT